MCRCLVLVAANNTRSVLTDGDCKWGESYNRISFFSVFVLICRWEKYLNAESLPQSELSAEELERQEFSAFFEELPPVTSSSATDAPPCPADSHRHSQNSGRMVSRDTKQEGLSESHRSGRDAAGDIRPETSPRLFEQVHVVTNTVINKSSSRVEINQMSERNHSCEKRQREAYAKDAISSLPLKKRYRFR